MANNKTSNSKIQNRFVMAGLSTAMIASAIVPIAASAEVPSTEQNAVTTPETKAIGEQKIYKTGYGYDIVYTEIDGGLRLDDLVNVTLDAGTSPYDILLPKDILGGIDGKLFKEINVLAFEKYSAKAKFNKTGVMPKSYIREVKMPSMTAKLVGDPKTLYDGGRATTAMEDTAIRYSTDLTNETGHVTGGYYFPVSLKYIQGTDTKSGFYLSGENKSATTLGGLTLPSTLFGLPVTNIGVDAFKNLTLTEKLELPSTLQTIGVRAFYNNVLLRQVNVENLTNIESVGERAFKLNVADITVTKKFLEASSTGAVFAGSSSKLTFEEGITEIDKRLFARSTDDLLNRVSIQDVKFPTSLKTIGAKTFDSITIGLLTLPEGLQTIGDYSFANTTIKNQTPLFIPESVMHIGKAAFATTKDYPEAFGSVELKEVVIMNKHLSLPVEPYELPFTLSPTGVIYGYEDSTIKPPYFGRGFRPMYMPTLESSLENNAVYDAGLVPTFTTTNTKTLTFTLNGENYDGVTPITTEGKHKLIAWAANYPLNVFKTYEFEVKKNNPPTSTTPITKQKIEKGKLLTIDLNNHFTDIENDALTFEVSTSDTHASQVWTTTKGELKFTATVDDTYEVTVKASDGKGYSDVLTFEVEVADDTAPPVDPPTEPTEPVEKAPGVIGTIPDLEMQVGDSLTYAIKDMFSSESEITDYVITSTNPATATLTVADGILTVQANEKGTTFVQVTATNKEGVSKPISFNVTVREEKPGIPIDKAPLDPVSNYKEVVNVTLTPDVPTKTIFVDGFLNDFNLDELTPTFKSTNTEAVDAVYDPTNKTITFTLAKPGFSNVQMTVEDKDGNKAAVLFMVDALKQQNASNDFIANGEIQLGKEAYVVELNDVYGQFANGEAITYGVSVTPKADTTTPETVTIKTARIASLTPSMRYANARTQDFTFEVPEGVETATLHEDGDLLIRLVNGKLVVDGKKAGVFDVEVVATTPSNPIPSRVKFELKVKSDQTGDGGTDIPLTPLEPSTPLDPDTDIPLTPLEPSKPTTPLTPLEPSKPTKPLTPLEPSKPTYPTTPSKPSEPAKPAEPIKPTPKPPVEVKPPTLEEIIKDIEVGVIEKGDGDLILDIEDKEDILGNTDSSITIGDGYYTITVDDKEYKFQSDKLKYDFTGKRAVHDDRGVYSTAMHFVEDKALTVTTPNKDNVLITSRENIPFKDVTSKYNHLNEIEDLYNYVITKGTTATTYSPKASITRGQFAAMISRAIEAEITGTKTSAYSLSDLDGKWYAKDVQYLIEMGIVEGFDDGTFGGEKTLSRQQASAMIARMLTHLEVDTSPNYTESFKDEDSIAPYAKGAVHFLAENNILDSGSTTNFNPKKNLTRDQMAKVLLRALKLTEFY